MTDVFGPWVRGEGDIAALSFEGMLRLQHRILAVKKANLLELAPAHWAATSQRPGIIALLEANHFRRAALG